MGFLSFFFISSSLLLFLVHCFPFLSFASSVTKEEASAYECGFEPLTCNHVPFCMKFFLLAIVFIVFDVEVSFLVPSLYTSCLIFSFTILLIIGLLYEYAYGGLSWVS